MTVLAQTPINSSTGNGVTTVFPYTFKIVADADIEVTIDDDAQTLNVDYTVTGAGDDSGGSVTFGTAPASLTLVVLRRNMALVRDTDYQDQGEIPAETLDRDFDATVLMVQQVNEQIGRAVKVAAGVSGFDGELPAPVAEAFLRINSAGDGFDLVSEVTPGALIVTPYIETLLNDTDAAAARTTLEAAKSGALSGSGITGAAASGPNTDITALNALASVPTVVQTAINDNKLAQIVTTQTGTVATGSTVIPFDNTIPQQTEGDQYMTLAITPKDVNSTLEIDVTFNFGVASGVYVAVALFQDAIANALAVVAENNNSATALVARSLTLTFTMSAGTTSATTFKVRAGPNTGSTVTFNGGAGTQNFGGVLASRITIKEYLP